MTMQATVMRYDAATRSGAVVLDDGTELPFPAEAMAGTGLRLLRPGQRVRIDIADGEQVTSLQILTLP